MSSVSSTRAYSTRELQAAAAALAAGRFTTGATTVTGAETQPGAGAEGFLSTPQRGRNPGSPANPAPGDLAADRLVPDPLASPSSAPLVRVRATNAGAGASTIALCIADAADSARVRTRILDAATPPWSGLLGATATELGAAAGWRRGRRGTSVLIDRVEAPVRGPAEVPVPRACERVDLTVLDVGWSMREIAAAADRGSWLATTQARVEVLVTRPHGLALSQTEAVLSGLEEQPTVGRVGMVENVVVVVVGASRWHERDFAAAGRRLRGAHDRGAVLFSPLMAPTAHPGLGHRRLPKQLANPSRLLLRRITSITGPLTATRSATREK